MSISRMQLCLISILITETNDNTIRREMSDHPTEVHALWSTNISCPPSAKLSK